MLLDDSYDATNDIHWFPIRYYTPSLDIPSEYTSLVELEPSHNYVNAQSILYSSSFPVLLVNSYESVHIREYICEKSLQNFENLQLNLRWMQRFGRSSSSNNDATWILDDIKISIWNGACFLQVLKEDFSGIEQLIVDSYSLVAADIRTPSCNSPGRGKSLDFRKGVSANEEFTRRSITISKHLGFISESCEVRLIESELKLLYCSVTLIRVNF